MTATDLSRVSSAGLLAFLITFALAACDEDSAPTAPDEELPGFLVDGRDIFRFYTFGNETFWTDTLRMHEIIQSSVDPMTALSVGLKVDIDALPSGLLDGADLSDPATTVELLRHDAVLGLKAEVDGDEITRIGTTCALCHSTVDNSVMDGIGRRRDGWSNGDLDPGLILSLSPALQEPGVQEVLKSWGPGRFDPRWNQDGINDPVVIPPAYGLAGVSLETYTGDGGIPYWNAYVAITQMHGHGVFVDSRIGVDVRWPEDLVTPVLAELQQYQLSLGTPRPPKGSFDSEAAARGESLFTGKASCATCHIPPLYTDVGLGLHVPDETCMDPTLAERSATGRYRTTPLRALWQHPPYFHDGSAATLTAVVEHYDTCHELGLTAGEIADLVEFLKSL